MYTLISHSDDFLAYTPPFSTHEMLIEALRLRQRSSCARVEYQIYAEAWFLQSCFFNRDLNRSCLVYMFSLRFPGSKFLINLRRQFRVRKFFRTQLFAGFEVILCLKLLFRKCVLMLQVAPLLKLACGIVFIRINGLIIQCLIACLIN